MKQGKERRNKFWRDLSAQQKVAVVVTGAAEVGLAAAAWTDLARRPASQVRGPKWRWALVIVVNFAGPIAYFRWGRVRPDIGNAAPGEAAADNATDDSAADGGTAG